MSLVARSHSKHLPKESGSSILTSSSHVVPREEARIGRGEEREKRGGRQKAKKARARAPRAGKWDKGQRASQEPLPSYHAGGDGPFILIDRGGRTPNSKGQHTVQCLSVLTEDCLPSFSCQGGGEGREAYHSDAETVVTNSRLHLPSSPPSLFDALNKSMYRS